MKKWNWTAFVVTTCVCGVGAASNPSIENLWTAMIVGLSFGAVIGLLVAYATRED